MNKQLQNLNNDYNNYIAYQARADINKANINSLVEWIGDSIEDYISDGEDISSLSEALNNNSFIEIEGALDWHDTNNVGSKLWCMVMTFPEFELTFNWLEDRDDGSYYTSEQTVVMTSCTIDDKQRENIECIFANVVDEIANAVSLNDGDSLSDTPKKPTLIAEQFEQIELFLNTYGEMSGYYRTVTSIIVGENSYSTTLLVEADNAIDAELKTLLFLAPGADGLVEQDGKFFCHSYNTLYEQTESTPLPLFTFEQEKGNHQIVRNNDIAKPQPSSLKFLKVSATPEALLTLCSEFDLAKKGTSLTTFLDLTDLLNNDGKVDLYSPSKAEDVASTLRLKPIDVAGKLIQLVQPEVAVKEESTLSSYTVNLALFQFFQELTEGTCITTPKLSYQFEEDFAIIFDLNETPTVRSYLETYLGKIETDTVIVYNGSHN
ncbi:hypothetical protein OH460_07830 [Vibrio sp. Makdt]|uniref:hypothetical protein n=1 Tax=Vibrio sp. Makdt TaxID=2998828 RepID=UPI0022CD4696|nr:hypothetical protein [Vibrio sp. Makdt]MDA0152206.1 hypothetical protein [Vibrio sp. Makdt]